MKSATTQNIRKAAVLIRSLDAETAATLLSQLSEAEATAVREAMHALGSVDPEEQSDVAAEMRRVKPVVKDRDGVELSFASSGGNQNAIPIPDTNLPTKFAFLDDMSAEMLAIYLAREHAQTIAVILSHLPPPRAAEVLALLPVRLQADTLQRVATLGDTDPESLAVLERELAAWIARQPRVRRSAVRSNEAVESILRAANPAARRKILASLMKHDEQLATRLAPTWLTPHSKECYQPVPDMKPVADSNYDRSPSGLAARPVTRMPSATQLRRTRPAETCSTALCFDDLARLNSGEIATLLKEVDPTVLVLALAGSSDELVNRVTKQMPRRIATSFRRQLRRLGPTRLSDVEAAQRLVAEAAGRRYQRRSAPVPSA